MTDEFAEIREAFALESAEMLAEIESALLALNSHPSATDEFNRLFRAVHTVKGSAGIVSADHVEQFCHHLEHLLVKVREENRQISPELLTLCLQCHDHIKLLISVFESGSEAPPENHSRMLSLLTDRQTETASCHEEPLPPPQPEPGSRYEVSGQDDSAAAQKVVRVDARKLDQLINLVVELVTAGSELEAFVKKTGDSSSIESASQVSQLVKKIQERAMVFRMVPVGDLFRRFQRLVHDLAEDGGKKIQLITSGTDTELDKVMAEKLREPLVHLIRNAVDHGLETVDERLAAGKPESGVIQMNAFHEAGCIVIEVRDDGRGISRQKLLLKATEKGLLRGQDPSDSELFSCIFEPGFSTLDQATMLSGRGVGMDAVKRAVEELRGRIDLTTTEGEGTCFQLRMPLSLALIDGFMVICGNDQYILPMDQVDETIDLTQEKGEELARRGYLDLRGEALPCLDLNQALQQPQSAQKGRFAVVVRQNNRRIGLAVDRLAGEIKAVIKPLGQLYRNARLISGATILGDGTIALIIDLPELIRGWGNSHKELR